MTGQSFFWHDYETFGRFARRDRPAQFAGIRTNLELEPIADPVAVMCQPATDQLPDVEACLLTGIVPQRCETAGVPEHAFAASVEQQLAAPGTIGVGFNSLSFDDEVTRFLFWRNLMEPYAREWRRGCGRWDLLGALRCAYALRPDGIVWPTSPEGRRTFRLQDLTAANGIPHSDAHDALSDVTATLGLARLLKTAQPQLWDFCLRLRDKDFVLEQLARDAPVLHVSGMYPAERGCLAIVWPFADHPHNANELIVWDLARDPTELLALDAAAIRARVFTRSEDLPPELTRLPLSSIHLKKSPVVVGNLKTLSAAQASRWGVDVDAALRHAEVARQISSRMSGVWRDVFKRPPSEPLDVDEALYGGFIRDSDAENLARIRALGPAALAADRTGFIDPRLHELVFRFRARNHPQTLTPQERERWTAHRRARLLEGQHGSRTLASFFEDVSRLRVGADARGHAILEELAAWGARMDASLRAGT